MEILSCQVAAGASVLPIGSPSGFLAHPNREMSGKIEDQEGVLPTKKSCYNEKQIAFALKQAELGTKVEEVCRPMGVSHAMFFRWNGLGPSERRRQLEEENRNLKKLVVDLSLEQADAQGRKLSA
jgi:putative transposase